MYLVKYINFWGFRLTELLSAERSATKENVTRKQARTAGEKEESEEEDAGTDSDDEDDDDIPYNPKNLPLGWDGKVIIFGCWLLPYNTTYCN